MYVNKHSMKARYSEVDRMNIVYHANYINWFEIGRTEFLRSLGYNYSDLEKEKIWLPVIEVNCKYKSPVTYDDEVTVETYILELSRVKIKFGYRVMHEDKLVVEGFTYHGITNEELKPIGLHRVRPDVYKVLSDSME
jgi:acyl-CoA thioester hydrolase